MKLTEETLEILKNMGEMSPSIVFKEGNRILHCPSDNSTPIMEAIITDSFPCDFQIYKVDTLVNFAKMMEEPEMEVTSAEVRLKDVNGRKAKMRCADMHVLRNTVDYSKTVRLPSVEATAVVTATDWKLVTRSASIVEAPQVAFVGKDGKILLSTYNVNDKDSDSFSLVVGETSHNFTMIVNLQSLKLLPGDYNVSLCFKGLLEFKRDNITYWLCASEKSKYA